MWLFAQKNLLKMQTFHKFLKYIKKRFLLEEFCDRIYMGNNVNMFIALCLQTAQITEDRLRGE